jgi:hypothetical protein
MKIKLLCMDGQSILCSEYMVKRVKMNKGKN